MDKTAQPIMLAYMYFDAPITWEEKYEKIFSSQISEVLFSEFGLENYPPRFNPASDTLADEDAKVFVKVFMNWLRLQLQIKYARDNSLGPCDQCGAEIHHKMSCHSGKFTKKA